MNSEHKSFGSAFTRGVFLNNPVLFQCAGLCPVIAGTASLNDALFISAELLVNLILTCIIASIFLKKVPRFIRVVIYLVIGSAVSCSALFVLSKFDFVNVGLDLKILIPVVAVNSLTAVRAETYAVKHTVRSSVYDALAAGVGASLVIIVVGVLREIIGSGSIAGIQLNTAFTMDGMSLPFGCLITLGFLAAMLKMMISRPERRPREKTNEEQPTEIEISFETELPEEADIGIEDYDDIESLLASTDEFLSSLTGGGRQ